LLVSIKNLCIFAALNNRVYIESFSAMLFRHFQAVLNIVKIDIKINFSC